MTPLAANVVNTGILSAARRAPHGRRVASEPAMTAGRSERVTRRSSSAHAPSPGGGEPATGGGDDGAASASRSRCTGPGISARAVVASADIVAPGSPSAAYALV